MKKENNTISPIVPFPAHRVKMFEENLFEDYMKAEADYHFRARKQESIMAAPRYSLAEILPKVAVNRLREIYRIHRLKPAAGKLKKQELIDALLQVLTDEQELEDFIKILPDMEWEFFKEALGVKALKDDDDMIDWANPALTEGFAYLFYHQKEFTYVVPDEVKSVYKLIDNSKLHEHMEVKLWLNKIACAAVNLYGALSLEELAGIINKHNHNEGEYVITPDILEYCLAGYTLCNDDYRIGEGYIAAYDFSDVDDDNELDMDEVLRLLEAREGKPRYLPNIKTFLLYEDPDYYEQTPPVKALMKALLAMGLAHYKVQDLIDTLHFNITEEEEMSEILSVLEECDVTLESGHADKIIQLIMQVFNSTRLWRNYGHTPDEIVRMMGREQPRSIHFGPGIEKMFLNGDMKIGEFERSSMANPLINDEFKDSFMSEVARMKSLVENSALPELQSSAFPTKKPGRNEPCPCGSGLKYKKCCGKAAGSLG